MYQFKSASLHAQNENSIFKPIGGPIKRGLDVILSLFCIISLIPIFLMLMVFIKLIDHGPVFYQHKRVGYAGKHFGCWKFRTMVVDSDQFLKSHLSRNLAAREEWKRDHKLRNDPRITWWGHFLRKSSLDELPQLINVLRGDMSLVGPRPVVPSELSRYGDELGVYLAARPGITGAWQVSGRSDCGYDSRVRLDVDYVRNWKLTTDVVILAKTVRAVLERRGSC